MGQMKNLLFAYLHPRLHDRSRRERPAGQNLTGADPGPTDRRRTRRRGRAVLERVDEMNHAASFVTPSLPQARRRRWPATRSS